MQFNDTNEASAVIEINRNDFVDAVIDDIENTDDNLYQAFVVYEDGDSDFFWMESGTGFLPEAGVEFAMNVRSLVDWGKPPVDIDEMIKGYPDADEEENQFWHEEARKEIAASFTTEVYESMHYERHPALVLGE